MKLQRHACYAVLALAALMTSTAMQAQTQRDPMQAPPEALVAPGASSAADVPWGPDGIAVVVREGKPYLVSGTRLYGVGQAVGPFLITRISETEVWLRRGTEVRKLPRFAGIQRQPSDETRGSNP